ncbi:MAG TPA: hypothetical protein VLC53_15575, partial [Myxococcota bacterium]|nr:hypothetical protein [Myxococcota bacterium]
MKATLLAAVPLLVLAACAAPNGATVAGGAPANATLYCWKNKLEARGDAVSCNWAVMPKSA